MRELGWNAAHKVKLGSSVQCCWNEAEYRSQGLTNAQKRLAIRMVVQVSDIEYERGRSWPLKIRKGKNTGEALAKFSEISALSQNLMSKRYRVKMEPGKQHRTQFRDWCVHLEKSGYS